VVAALAAARRTTTSVVVLRPGSALTLESQHMVVAARRGHAWPYSPIQPVEPDSEDEVLRRKKILLRILCLAEAERLGLSATREEVQAMSDSFRARFGMEAPQATRTWLARAGIDDGAFARLMREFALVARVEAIYEHAIDDGVPLQRAAWTAHAFAREMRARRSDAPSTVREG
jgi:hypothetical protein